MPLHLNGKPDAARGLSEAWRGMYGNRRFMALNQEDQHGHPGKSEFQRS